jgi:hypothetical protein
VKLLVPILSKKEANPFFVKEILSLKPKEIILLSVIDSNKEITEFSFASSEIALANSIMNELEKQLTENNKKTEIILEWGESIQKTVNSAQLFKTKNVLLIKNDLLETKKLIKELKKKKIQVIQVELKEPELMPTQSNALKEIAEKVTEKKESIQKKTIELNELKPKKKKSFLELIGLK